MMHISSFQALMLTCACVGHVHVVVCVCVSIYHISLCTVHVNGMCNCTVASI